MFKLIGKLRTEGALETAESFKNLWEYYGSRSELTFNAAPPLGFASASCALFLKRSIRTAFMNFSSLCRTTTR
jgi:hypothetical protein